MHPQSYMMSCSCAAAVVKRLVSSSPEAVDAAAVGYILLEVPSTILTLNLFILLCSRCLIQSGSTLPTRLLHHKQRTIASNEVGYRCMLRTHQELVLNRAGKVRKVGERGR